MDDIEAPRTRADVRIYVDGSVAILTPVSPEGTNWVGAHISREGYQPYRGKVLCEIR